MKADLVNVIASALVEYRKAEGLSAHRIVAMALAIGYEHGLEQLGKSEAVELSHGVGSSPLAFSDVALELAEHVEVAGEGSD